MSHEGVTSANDSSFEGKSPKNISRKGSFLNSTLDSINEEKPGNFALELSNIPTSLSLEASDEEMDEDSEIDELQVSLHSLGLDFV